MLFDENTSYRIIKKIIHVFPGSEHVSNCKLHNNHDSSIWSYAKENGFVIVTFDEDFNDLSLIQGYPPKVIWLRTGNARTNEVADLLMRKEIAIKDFITSEDGCLELI